MKVVHCKREPYDVYIGRPSKWGNHYSHLPKTKARYRAATRELAIELYEQDIRNDQNLIRALPEIAGKTLGCWCSPQTCHGDVLVKLCIEFGLVEV